MLGIFLVVGYVLVQFVIFQFSLSRLPASWTIGGQAFPNQTIDEALTQLEIDLQQPAALRYLTSTITLEPAMIDFTFDITETQRLAQDARMRNSSLTDFLRHLILQPPAPRDIPVVASYSDEKARAFLADVATRFDVPPRPPAPQIDQLTLTPGQSGRLLNIVDSMPPLEDAVKSAQQRRADLVVEDKAAPPPAIDQLKQLLQARLAAFEGAASVFVKDLQTGEELHLNPNVPFSGGGVMKLPIVAEIYRKYDLPLDITTTQRLTAALTTELGCRGAAFDLAEVDAPVRLFAAALAALGRVDVLVNNAGFNKAKDPLARVSAEDLDASYAVNVRAPVLLAREALECREE